MQRELRTLIDDRADLRWGTMFLALLLAIPVAGVIGLPLLLLLLLLFLCNPGGLGLRLGQSSYLRYLPGFRSGQRGYMAAASVLYLLPLSALGLIVLGVDGIVLGLWSL